ncbi:ExeM/NucH family extracellular endonuclease, partial [Paraglaciecola sp.]|uniref:ExeM/NucH family extracellular endonuclease n=1 Tax=Paraglaciecola sp. TaxID=1920173 RepID=UPI0030F43FE1
MKFKYPALLALFMVPVTQATVFINEIHYDNDGGDVGEAIEIAGTAGTDLSGMSLVLYNGNNNSTYGTIVLSGVLADQQAGFGTLSFAGPSSGIQNGAPDGFALVDASNNVIQFLSYEGTMTAANGPATGLTSIDIGVSEGSSTPVGASLQLTGNGSVYEDFTWIFTTTDTFGFVNFEQSFSGDTGGGDTGGAVISGSVCTNCPDLEKYKDLGAFNPTDYYAAVQTEIELGSSAQVIKSTINSTISHDIKSLSYAEVWTALTYTDEDPNNTDNVILWYTARSQAKSTNGSGAASSNGDNWNREHSWPKSHGFPNESQLAYTDIHHLRATDISVNGSRGNLDFDNSDSPLSESPSNRIDSDSFEPRNDIKGDVARMMFYMDTRYEGAGSDNLADLILVNRLTSTSESNLGFLCTLIAWNNADAVDSSEQRRNDRIYELQGNRNPFIDNPAWVTTLYPADSCDSNGGDTGGGDTGGGDTGGGDTGGGDTSGGSSTLVFINEIHYDNSGTDVGEAIEVAGPAGTDLSGMSLVLYNGSSSQLKVYGTIALSGVVDEQQAGFGTLSFTAAGIQNGSPDGIALVNAQGGLIQFLSYEGSFTALDGPAAGIESTDIGVEETSGAAIGESLQLVGSGFRYQDFTWQAPAGDNFGAVNQGQTFVAPAPFINEIHYDNAGSDVDEAIEIAGLAGTDLTGMSLVLYNGSSSQLKVYGTIALSGVITNQQGGFGTISFDATGMQNGSPDGIALVDSNNNVIQFLSYEGSFTPIDGPAAGIESTDIGVVETNSTAVGQSLQLSGSGVQYSDFTWQETMANTFGAVNTNQTFGSGSSDGGTVTIGQCSDPATLISEIQGRGLVSPVVGEDHVLEAVVTASFSSLSGFFVQEEAVDMDNDSQTSEGLFVYYTGTLPDTGTIVRVVGKVEEYYEKTQLNITTSPLNCGTDTAVATSISLPFADTLSPESLEGMFVSMASELTVSDNFNLGKFGEVTLSNGRLYNPTNLYPAGSIEAANLVSQNALNRVILDDGMNGSNPADVVYPAGGLSALNTLRGGDTVSSLTGILDYSFGQYRVIPTEFPTFVATNSRTAEPELSLGNLKVASLNVLNYFTSLNPTYDRNGPRGANTAEELVRQKAKTVSAIIALDADVVGLMEIENNGTGPGSALDDLVSEINAQLGVNTYAAVATGSSVGTDMITTALIYKPASVSLSASVMINNDSIFNRPPIAQTFALVENGETFTVVVNHFKSKSCGSASGLNADQGDGQGCHNAKRVSQSQALSAWLSTAPGLSSQRRQLIIGDLNAYAKEDPILALEARGFTNLLENFQGAEAYSYSFGGTVGYLDHALASADLLAAAVDANDWHINADEPIVLDYNMENKTE